MRLAERTVTLCQPWCDWCGENVGMETVSGSPSAAQPDPALYPSQRTQLRILARHRRTHRQLGRIGLSILAKDNPRPGVWR